jgi:dihydrofolate reductase
VRRIIGGVFISLDGVIQAPGGPTEDTTGGFDMGGWVFKYGDEQFGEAIGKLFDREYDLLLGRRTYDIFAAYWPYYEGGEDNSIATAFNACNKYVLTTGDQPLDWANSHRLKTVEDVAALKRSDGPDLIIQGSSTLYPALLAAGLIDRLTLMTFPVTLGPGKRLFGEGTPARKLTMVEQSVTSSGIICSTYEPAETITDAGSASPPPVTNDREDARQRKMKDGSW